MKTTLSLITALVVLSSPLICFAGDNTTPQLDYCWANGVIYGLLIPSDMKPGEGLRNDLYVFRNLKGQRPVAESGPEDVNFQKGRFQIVFMDFTPKGISALDPDSNGVCEYEITTSRMIKSFEGMGYLKLAGRGPLVDYKVVSPEFYISQKAAAEKSRSALK
jgi:hypothetical protein